MQLTGSVGGGRGPMVSPAAIDLTAHLRSLCSCRSAGSAAGLPVSATCRSVRDMGRECWVPWGVRVQSRVGREGPLVVHQNGEEELGCSRWSFTRTISVTQVDIRYIS